MKRELKSGKYSVTTTKVLTGEGADSSSKALFSPRDLEQTRMYKSNAVWIRHLGLGSQERWDFLG